MYEDDIEKRGSARRNTSRNGWV